MGGGWKRRGREGVKGFLLLKWGGKKVRERGKGGESRGGEGPAAGGGGSCSKVLGDRRPGIKNTGSTSWKPLRSSFGHARDDDDDSIGYASKPCGRNYFIEGRR